MRSSYDVVPAQWVTAGKPLPVVEPTSASQKAYIFPAPALATVNTAMPEYRSSPGFFGRHNRFPDSAELRWKAKKSASEIVIKVSRQSTPASGKSGKQKPDRGIACVNVDVRSRKEIGKLEWKEICDLQRDFRCWLLSRGGFLGIPDEDRFGGLQSNLETLWRDHIFAEATFENFAGEHLKGVEEFDVKAEGVTMKAIPLTPGERLQITWGTSAFYPFPDSTTKISGGYNRLASGGQTELRISTVKKGLALFPDGTPRASATKVDETNDDDGKFLLPFPTSWNSMFGTKGTPTMMVPIFAAADLSNKDLLRYYDKDEPQDGTPAYLYLLAPLNYVKADSADGGAKRYAFDARTSYGGGGQNDKLPLGREYLLIGCTQKGRSAVQGELTRLLKSSLGGAAATEGYTCGLFGHQSVVEGRYNVTFRGAPLEGALPHGQKWGEIVSACQMSLLAEASIPGKPAALEARRTVCDRLGKPVKTMRLHFHTTAQAVLNRAYVSEGDELIPLR